MGLTRKDGFVLWFCGIPGSGKTTVSHEAKRLLESEGVNTEYVSMDEIRTRLFPYPKYSDAERDAAYRALALVASFLSKNEINVIVDGTAHKRVWRDLAKKECANFLEVYVRCLPDEAIRRAADREVNDQQKRQVYLDALERLRTGRLVTNGAKVPGVDEPFEESEGSETTFVIDCDDLTQATGKLLLVIKEKFPAFFPKS